MPFTGCYAVIFLAACHDSGADDAVIPVDYSDMSHWLTIPAVNDKEADLFFVYPTCYSGDDMFAGIDDQLMRLRANGALEAQASAFSTVANVYAPLYRQTGNSTLKLSAEELERVNSSFPQADIMASFDYYIKHFNNGRPFILAGHSQGSLQVLNALLVKYMASHPDVYSRMVAAYVIGYSVTAGLLAENPHLKFASGATDAGVIISYNTEMPGMMQPNPVVGEGAIAINPVNWRRDNTLATAGENLPSRLPGMSPDGVYWDEPHYADARVNPARGVVECSTVDPGEYHRPDVPFPYGVFHGVDYALYYYSLRKNAGDRLDAYLGR